MKYLVFAALVLLLPCCKETENAPVAVADAVGGIDTDAVEDVDVAADVSAVDAAAVATPEDVTSTEQ